MVNHVPLPLISITQWNSSQSWWQDAIYLGPVFLENASRDLCMNIFCTLLTRKICQKTSSRDLERSPSRSGMRGLTTQEWKCSITGAWPTPPHSTSTVRRVTMCFYYIPTKHHHQWHHSSLCLETLWLGPCQWGSTWGDWWVSEGKIFVQSKKNDIYRKLYFVCIFCFVHRGNQSIILHSAQFPIKQVIPL